MTIEIEVLYHTDSTRQFDDLGLSYDVEDLEKRKMTFYSIDAIAPNYWDEDNEFCNVFVGGEKWICPMKYSELKKKIEST